MDEPLSILTVYGPLGVMAIISMLVAARLYRDLKEERAAHQKTAQEWQERHAQKAETWASRYHELAQSMNDVLASLERRYDKR